MKQQYTNFITDSNDNSRVIKIIEKILQNHKRVLNISAYI
jgi:hypothetical protein